MVPDCIYTELSFVAGYKDFSERAETKGSYRNYVSGLSKMVWIYSIPVYMIGQKNTLKSLRPDRLLSIQVDYPMEQFRGFVAVWRDEVIDVHSRTEILVYLNKNYKMVYDPSCGYLSIARFMPDCKFMFSDSNPKCIGGALATLKELYGNEKAN